MILILINNSISGHHGRCKGAQKGKDVSPNGPCNTDEDCRFEQYCTKSKCANRKTTGGCTNDSQCMSNFCFLFRCQSVPVKNKQG